MVQTGWSKVTYKGKTAYIVSEYLSQTKPEEKKSDNNNLKKLLIEPGTIKPEFSKDITNYTATVGADIKEIKVSAMAEDEKSKIEISGDKDLKVGENIVKIEVTAEDTTVKTYQIVVTKSEEQQVKLKELKVEGFELEPKFNSDVYEYKIKLEDKDISELNITATPSLEKSKVEISGNKDLKDGSIIKILVKTEDEKNTVTYQILVNIKSENEDEVITTENSDDNRKINTYVAIGIGVLFAIIIVAIVIVKKKRKEKDEFEEYNLDNDTDSETKQNEDNGGGEEKDYKGKGKHF